MDENGIPKTKVDNDNTDNTDNRVPVKRWRRQQTKTESKKSSKVT